jgi:hypothetical protein
MKTLLKLFPALFAAILLAGCASENQRSVCAIPFHTPIDTIYVVNNHVADNPQVLNAIVNHLLELGFNVQIAEEGTAPENSIELSYDCKTVGDTFKSLGPVNIEVRKGQRMLGYAHTDASGAMRFNKTVDRIDPILDGIFEYVLPKKTTPTDSKS